MSLKFAALGGLVSLSPLGAATRADHQTRNSGSAGSYQPILISLGWWRGAARETRGRGVAAVPAKAANCPSN